MICENVAFTYPLIFLTTLQKKASDNDYLMLKVALFGSFYPNYFIRSHGNLDMKTVLKEISEKDPMTTLYLMGFPSEQARYGELYVNQVKEIFKDTQPNKAMIDVQFENSKILVGFRSNTTSRNRGLNPGKSSKFGEGSSALIKTNLTPIVQHHVYVSMKLKMQSKEQMEIRLYKTAEAHRLV